MKILIIQTAFIGDVVLATPLVENLKRKFPECKIDFLLRKGNEAILEGHPLLNKLIIFDKRKRKIRNLIKLIHTIRKQQYELVINVQRFFSTGLITVLSGGKERIGFDKNPLSIFYTKKIEHNMRIDQHIHEVDRNLLLIADFVKNPERKPKLYPRNEDLRLVKKTYEYVCIAPGSVWFTKKFPMENWVQLINIIPNKFTIHLIGGPEDRTLCETIRHLSTRNKIVNSAGELSVLQSVALVKNARMTFTNDSAPLHFASAVNAPVTAIYCSTIPEFGFGPLSDDARVIETSELLSCRPCGLHGKRVCPEKHFRCAQIPAEQILAKADLH